MRSIHVFVEKYTVEIIWPSVLVMFTSKLGWYSKGHNSHILIMHASRTCICCAINCNNQTLIVHILTLDHSLKDINIGRAGEGTGRGWERGRGKGRGRLRVGGENCVGRLRNSCQRKIKLDISLIMHPPKSKTDTQIGFYLLPPNSNGDSSNPLTSLTYLPSDSAIPFFISCAYDYTT